MSDWLIQPAWPPNSISHQSPLHILIEPIAPGSNFATVREPSFGSDNNSNGASLPLNQGAAMPVRRPDRSAWLIQPSAPSGSRTLRQLSYSWMTSIGSPDLRYIQSTA